MMCSMSRERNMASRVLRRSQRQLTEEFGRGWNKAALTRMMQFAERFSDPKIVACPSY